MSEPGARGAAVRLEAVELRYGEVRAVDGVSLEIRAGEFFTVLGPSGSGKTSMLHLIAGFQLPGAGELYLDGARITRLPPYRRGIGVVFQSYALFPHLTVFENVAFPLRVRGTPRAEIGSRVEAALELVQLGGYGGRRIGQLSGGQQQRVAVARAVVFGPRLLLMDEPLSALDAKLRRAMQGELKGLQQRLGVTVVYVTHDQAEALALSDRIAVMREGRVEQVATPRELYERPRSRFVADFIGDANILRGEVVRTDGQLWRLGLAGTEISVEAPEGAARRGSVNFAVRPERVVLDPPKSLDCALTGRVLQCLYAGDASTVVVELDGGARLTVRYGADGAKEPQPGDRVLVGWAREHAVVLNE